MSNERNNEAMTDNPLTPYLKRSEADDSGRPVVLLADIDGTLVDHTMALSEGDLSAIEEFMARGHYFSLATGRGRTNAELHMSNVPSNFPAVFSNGSLLYDRGEKKVILQHEMATEELSELFRIMQHFYPEIMIQIYTADEIFLITDNPADDYRVANHEPYQRVAFSKIRGMRCNKVLFGMQPNNCDAGKLLAEDHVTSHLPEMRVVKSQTMYLELTPAGISKGAMVEYIRDHTDALIAVAGDYYNDIEMMENADLSYTLSTSPPEVQAAADVIFESRPGEFISEVVEDLLKRRAGQGR